MTDSTGSSNADNGSAESSPNGTIVEAPNAEDSSSTINLLMERLKALEVSSQLNAKLLLESEKKRADLVKRFGVGQVSGSSSLGNIEVENSPIAARQPVMDSVGISSAMLTDAPLASSTVPLVTPTYVPVMSTSVAASATPFSTPMYFQQYTNNTAGMPTQFRSATTAVPPTPTPCTSTYMVYGALHTPTSHQFPSQGTPGNFSGFATPRKLLDLPEFNGRPEDWPVFVSAFYETTNAYGYTALENTFRLQKCLKGPAREEVDSLLINPRNVERIVEHLEFRFGQPEILVKSQLQKVREIAPIAENHLERLVPFATKVQNLTTFLQNANATHYLGNPTLLEELVSKMPMTKRIDWSSYSMGIKPYPTVVNFSDWISQVAKIIGKAIFSSTPTPINNNVRSSAVQHRSMTKPLLAVSEENAAQTQAKRVIICAECGGEHLLTACSRFLNKSTPERWEMVKSKRLCFCCLLKGHGINNCRRKKICKETGCKKMHNFLLHETTRASSSTETQQVTTTRVNSFDYTTTKLLFKVLPVELRGQNNRVIRTFAFLDEGSSVTLIDEALADELGYKVEKKSLSLQWFGGKATKLSSMSLTVQVKGVNKKSKWFNLNAQTVPSLNLPVQTINLKELHDKYHELKNLPIAEYCKANPKILIGLDNCHVIPNSKTVKANRTIIAANTPLGWVFYGKTAIDKSPYQLSIIMHAHESNEESLENLVADYFTTENFGTAVCKQVVESKDVSRAKKILEETTKKVGSFYETGLLWKSDEVVFPDNQKMAEMRLFSIHTKMRKNVDFAKAYCNSMKDYIQKGYARKLSPREALIKTPKTWYLPHFAVFNANKPGKLRIVFDAAAEMDGISLNTQLLKGPDENQSLMKVLFRFREKPIGLCADIKEMFLRIRIREEDTHSQRFLWNDNLDEPPETYVMTAMIFGATCSPCSAQYVKNKNAVEVASDQPEVIDAILKSHYVDDFVASFRDEDDALSIGSAVKRTHAEANFELRGFVSNSAHVQGHLNSEVHTETVGENIKALNDVDKVLGMFWNSSIDEFIFKLNMHRVDPEIITARKCPTKRQLLSLVMSVYDPFGMLADLLIYGKILLQDLWRTGTNWDEEVPRQIFTRFAQWVSRLKMVDRFHLHRCYSPSLIKSNANLELHVFVDASEAAFAAVAYWRVITFEEIDVCFIAGKTKCAPLKLLSVPRLELQAAVLGTRLKNTIIESHSVQPMKTVLWTDSKTVVSWIKSDHRQYKPFVAHRVSEILETTNENNWQWLSTKLNVADMATRAKFPVLYEPNSKWIEGPEFLKKTEDSWPIHEDEQSSTIEERRSCFLIAGTDKVVDFSRYTNFLRLVRIIAWILRPLRIVRQKINGSKISELSSALTTEEIQAAEITLYKIVQREEYLKEITELQNGMPVSKDSYIFELSPQLNENGLIYVSGRLNYALFLPETTRHPIILPTKHPFTELVVKWYHEKFHHQNEELIVNEVRRKFWIPRLRATVKRIKTTCQQCRNDRAKPEPPLMGQLPLDRVTPFVRPFTFTGLDYFGPMFVSIGRRREKRWAALFTCLTTRAIHIELAADLSTDACIICIRNFVNRRGIPVKIRSDMGTNFVGADGEIRKVKDIFDQHHIQNELSKNQIKWEFNCPGNPSSGGCWERLIQSTKKVLAKTLKEQAPQIETLRSLLIEAENIVNSRPLTHLPISHEDEDPLTPNHFLLGSTNSTQTPGEENVCTRKQYRISQQLKNHFWRRWIREYLPTLTKRTKWFKNQQPIKIGDVVLICDESLARSQWKKGRIVSTFAAKDGVIRIAEVKTDTGTLRRPVSKLAVLDVVREAP